MRTALALAAAALLTAVTGPTAVAGPSVGHTTAAPRPAPGDSTQLITAEAPDAAATTGRLTWWDRRDGHWVAAGSAPARFGAGGLVDGEHRTQGTSTTPTGVYDLPYAFGIAPEPAGTRYGYRPVTENSWWCQDNASRAYNRWVEGLPGDCRAGEAEHLADYTAQYDHALVIGFNYDRPVRGRGAGIFLHVNGAGATAGCVSVPAEAMRSVLAWADPARHPRIAISVREPAATRESATARESAGAGESAAARVSATP